MDHTISLGLICIAAVACITIGRPSIATCIGLLGLFVHLR